MSDCLFCKMVSGEIEPDTVYEDDEVLAFRDIDPQAPTHVLVIPKQHISTLNELSGDNLKKGDRNWLRQYPWAAWI